MIEYYTLNTVTGVYKVLLGIVFVLFRFFKNSYLLLFLLLVCKPYAQASTQTGADTIVLCHHRNETELLKRLTIFLSLIHI